MRHSVLWPLLLSVALCGCASRRAPVAPPPAEAMTPEPPIAHDTQEVYEPIDEIDLQIGIIRKSLKGVEIGLERLAEVGDDDPAAPDHRFAIDRYRRDIRDSRARLAELGHPLPAVELDFEDSETLPGGEREGRALPALVLRSTGDAPLHVKSLAVVADRPAAVPLRDGCSGRTLQPGEHCVVEPLYDPSDLPVRRAELELNHDGQEGYYAVPLPVGQAEMAAREAMEVEPVDRLGPVAAPVVSRTFAAGPVAPTEPDAPPAEVAEGGDEEAGDDEPPEGDEDGEPAETGVPPEGDDGKLAPPASTDAGPGPGVPAPDPGGATTIVFAVLGALLLAMIVAAATFVASPSTFQYKVFNTALAAGAALVVTAVARAMGLPERAAGASGTRFAGFVAQGGVGLMTFLMVYLGQPLRRLAPGGAGPAPAAAAVPAAPIQAPARSIFISYRRADSADVTGRIYEHLVGRYGKKAVFKDVEDIHLGVDFRQTLAAALRQCRVVVAVIGPKWATLTDAEGRRRLEDPADYLRLEVESALGRNLPLIPLLVHGASVPSPAELPESLEGLAFRNGMPVRPDPDFANDMRRLITDLDKILEGGSGLWGQEGNGEA